MKTIQNVIFDLGGVVFDWNPDAIVQTVFADVALQNQIRRQIFEHPEWAETDRGTLSRNNAIYQWAKRTGQSNHEIEALLDQCDVALQPKVDTLALLNDLSDQGYSLYCLSNMPSERYDYLRQHFDFWGKFEGIVISGHVKMIKPEAGIYQHLLRTYSLDPAVSLFLDDSPENIEAAQVLGIQGIVFTNALTCREMLIERYQLNVSRE